MTTKSRFPAKLKIFVANSCHSNLFSYCHQASCQYQSWEEITATWTEETPTENAEIEEEIEIIIKVETSNLTRKVNGKRVNG